MQPAFRVLAVIGLVMIAVGVFNPIMCSEFDECKAFEDGLFDHRRLESEEDDLANLGFAANAEGILMIFYLMLGLLAVLVDARRALGIITIVLGLSLFVFFDLVLIRIDEASDFADAGLSLTWLLFLGGLVLLITSVVAGRQVDSVESEFVLENKAPLMSLLLVASLVFLVAALPPVFCADTEEAECGIAEDGSVFESESLDEEFNDAVTTNELGLLMMAVSLATILASFGPHPERSWMSALAMAAFTLTLFIAVYDVVDYSNKLSAEYSWANKITLQWGWVVFIAAIIIAIVAATTAQMRPAHAPSSDQDMVAFDQSSPPPPAF